MEEFFSFLFEKIKKTKVLLCFLSYFNIVVNNFSIYLIKFFISKEKEKKIIDSVIKPEPMNELIRNLKRELNFERDRNLELEQLLRKLERELS